MLGKVCTQVAIFFAIYLIFSWWQTRQLLSDHILTSPTAQISRAETAKSPALEGKEDGAISSIDRLVTEDDKKHLPKVTGEYFTLSSTMDEKVNILASDQPTILYFFAPWCQICHLSMDNLQDFYIDNPDVDIIAIALDYKSQKAVTDFTLQHQLTFPVVFGDYKVKKHFKIFAYPSYYFVDPGNNIKQRSVGYTSSMGLYFSRLFI